MHVIACTCTYLLDISLEFLRIFVSSDSLHYLKGDMTPMCVGLVRAKHDRAERA